MSCSIERFRIDPLFLIFAHEAVAAHSKPCEETIFANGVESILGAARDKMAARAIARGDDILMKMDELFADGLQEGGILGLFNGLARTCEVGIFAPGLYCSYGVEGNQKEDKSEHSLKRCLEHEEGDEAFFD